MSRTPTIPIATALNNIMQAKQGGDVRDSIHDAIASCYNDVSSPELNTAALEAALQTKIDEGEMAGLTIADGSITGDKIADGAITGEKLATGTISTTKIADGTITKEKLAPNVLGDFSAAMITFLSHLTGTFDDEHGQDYIEAVIASLGGGGGSLPDIYQEVEYVISNGNQFFDTGISAGALPIKVEAGLYKTSQAPSEQAVVTAKVADNSTAWELGWTSAANVFFAFSKSSARVTDAAVYGNKIDVVARFNASSPYKQLDVTANETTLTSSDTGVNDATVGYSSASIRFFGSTSGQNRVACRLYYCKVYNNANELVLDMIPCRLKTGQTGGLYDRVSKKFFKSSTSSQLTPGPDVISEGGNE